MPNYTFSADELEAFRSHADPMADEVVQKIMADGSGRSISELFDQLITNSDYNKVDLPPEIANYFKATSQLPEWADPAKIKIGQAVFAEFGPEICLLLLCKSLPEAYSCKKGALVLYQTGRLAEGQDGSLERFTRRLMETSQFVVNVCTPNGFAPEGSGLVTAQKVRLIHATVRYFIIEKGNWDSAENGLPINQEDMAGTLQSFSALILEGLGQLGITLTPEQMDGYFHCWRIAGHIVGVDPKLNPEKYEEGLKMGYAIFNHQREGSQEGVMLTKAVAQFMENVIPGNLFDDTPNILFRYFLGDKTADLLEVEESHTLFARILPRLLKVVFQEEEKLENNHHFYKKLAGSVSLHLIQGLLHYFNDYKGIHFYLPPGLQENWELKTSWKHHLTITPPVAGYRLAVEKKNSSIK